VWQDSRSVNVVDIIKDTKGRILSRLS
jgi:hypothetical protein